MFNATPLHILDIDSYHPDYLELAPTWRTIRDLSEGYTALRGNVERYLPRKPNEDDQLYSLRAAKLAYTPIMSSVVNRYLGKLAGGTVSIEGETPEVAAFRQANQTPGEPNRNEKGLLGQIFKDTLLYGCTWLCVDKPVTGLQIVSLYEEQANKQLTPYVNSISPLTVINYGEGWHITKCWSLVTQPFKQPTKTLVYTLHTADVTVTYEVQAKTKPSLDNQGNTYLELTHVLVGKDYISVKDENAIVKPTKVSPKSGVYNYVRSKVTADKWLCKQLYSKQIQHLQIESAWTDTGYLAGTIQRVYTPLPAPPIDDERQPYRAPDYQAELAKTGNSHILIGANYQFVESSGGAVTHQQGMLDKIEAQMKELTALHFASSSTGVLAQSGKSKAVDMSLLDDTLKEYGTLVVSIYNEVLELVSYYNGGGNVSAVGLTEFNTLDMDSLVGLIDSVGKLANFPDSSSQLLYSKLMELAKINT